MIWVVEISECDGLGRTGLGAGGDVFAFFQLPSFFSIGLILGPHVTVVAEGAFFDDASHSGRYLRGKGSFHAFGKRFYQGKTIPPIKVSGVIGTCCLAVSTSDTTGIDLADDTGIVINLCGRNWTDTHAGGVMASPAVFLAMHTGSREIAYFRFREWFSICDLKELHPAYKALFIRFVPKGDHIIL